MAYVYKHIRSDTNEIFYIGIGKTKKRINSHINRNNHWLNIVNKVGFDYEIIEDGLSWEEACKLEQYWIKFYGRNDLNEGPLVNMTDGGDGMCGLIHSNETKEKIKRTLKQIRKNNNNPFYGKLHSSETKEKMSKSLLNHIVSTETKEKMKNSALNLDNRRGKSHNAKKIKYIPSGKIYDCILDAAEELNMSRITIQLQLNGKIKNSKFIIIN